ncbi:MAG: hypothetical protein AB1730_16330 [Myxococcota bacterium]
MTALPVIPDVLDLQLKVRDAEVVATLLAQPEKSRHDYAVSALRIGVLAKHQAAGQLDVRAIQGAGDQLMKELASALSEHGGKLTGEVAGTLQRYFDPKSGVLQERLAALVQPNGELSRVLEAHVGAKNSVLAQTLVQHLGETSPLFKLLSPTDASGVKAQLERMMAQALEQQRARILEQFSLDVPQSALSRLVRELSEQNGELTTNLAERVEDVVREFSLDDDDSALSRLVRRVEQAQQNISREFTLDDEASALSRMRRELTQLLKQQADGLAAFKAEMTCAIGALQAHREAVKGTPRAGQTFEAALGAVLAEEARRGGDVCTPVGATTGEIRACKVGDFVVELGADHRAAGTLVVWEAKAAAATVKEALAELDKARRNRGARLGVFVFEKGHAPRGFGVFERHGDDLLLAWDPLDATDALVLRVAYSAVKALAVQQAARDESTADAEAEIEATVNVLTKQLDLLDTIKTSATTAKTGLDKVLRSAETVRTAIEESIESLERVAAALPS